MYLHGIVYDNTENQEPTCDFVKCTNCGKLQLIDPGEDSCLNCGSVGECRPVFPEEPEFEYVDAADILGHKGFAVIRQDEDCNIRQVKEFSVILRVEGDCGYELGFPTEEGAAIFAARNTMFPLGPATEYEPLKCMDASSASMFSYHYIPRITIEKYVAGKKMTENHISTTDQLVETLWCALEDIPVNPETEELDAAWFIFETGADKYEDVWRWFDDHYSKGVAYLVNA